jgi:hypothetical protein
MSPLAGGPSLNSKQTWEDVRSAVQAMKSIG